MSDIMKELAQKRLNVIEAQVSQPVLSFREFIETVNPYYQFYPYLDKLINLLQKMADDELTRLMVFMPPRHGKSELISRLFSAYYLYRHSDRWVALTSYGAELAHTLSRNARDNYTRNGSKLKDDAATVKNWETGQGGGLWASGVGGPAAGKGFNLGIIDDPIKDASEAFSPLIRRRNQDWFNSVFWTRREPQNAVVVVHTRWGKNDLAGHILQSEDEEPEHWHIVHHEAIKQDSQIQYPITCTIEVDNRKTGEALAPARYPLEELKKILKRIGNFFFNALYQQSPTQRQGRVYHAFDDKNIGPHSNDLQNIEGYYHSHDFGAVNHVWGLWAKVGKQYFLVYEQKLPEGTTEARADAIKRVWADKHIVAGWGGAASEKQYRLDFQAAGVAIRTPPTAIKSVQDEIVEAQVRQANEMFGNETLMICSDMVFTLDQLENCVRDDNGKIADKSAQHYLDMLRYFAVGISRKGWSR